MDKCKESKAPFLRHYQPRVPLNENYYNLLEDGVLEWQNALAKEYGVFGFCFYHYWFKNGKKLLEKPAEKLLQREEIDQPFFFVGQMRIGPNVGMVGIVKLL